jgi:hypothetical protein
MSSIFYSTFSWFYALVNKLEQGGLAMGYPTKVQLIKRRQSEQWYINFPAAIAQAMDFERGETVEWSVEDKGLLALKRQRVPPSLLKKKLQE